MDTLSDSNKYNISIFCIFIIWLTELLILLRFILRIIYHQDHPALAAATAANNSVMPITTTLNAEERIYDSRSKHSSQASECSLERLHNNTQLGDQTITYFANEPYTYVVTKNDNENDPHYVNESEGSERKVMTPESNRIIRSADGAIHKIDLLSELATPANESDRIIITADNTYNSPSAKEASRRIEEAEENAKIKEFLTKLKDEHIKVGNKGLDFTRHSAE